MTIEEAGTVVGRLNAAFTRDALEPASAQLWVEEIATLHSFEAAYATARLIGREGERFPTLHEFRVIYRREVEARAPKAIEEPLVEMPDDVRAWLVTNGADSWEGILGSIEDTTSMLPRPVHERRMRRAKGSEVGPPTEAEKADAIRVLALGRRAPHWLYLEAERIFCEASE